jgi:glutamate carboxypeptidase
MDHSTTQALNWIDSQRERMTQQVINWAEINSGSYNTNGVNAVAASFVAAAEPLNAIVAYHDLDPHEVIGPDGTLVEHPIGQAVSLRKRPEAPVQILLNAHLDTVFGMEHPFQTVEQTDSKLHGPGVADIKGGLAVMLYALLAFEQTTNATQLGWEIVLNPDEEIGTPSSEHLLRRAAAGKSAGLIFEPTLPDGTFISERGGSANYSIVIHGRAAHVGRDYGSGRSALRAAAKLTVALEALNSDELTVNVGKIDGGGPSIVVPDLAVCHFNIRGGDQAAFAAFATETQNLVAAIDDQDGLSATLHTPTTRPPKPFDEATQKLFSGVSDCCNQLGIGPAKWTRSGGVCDGNTVGAVGLPTIDTLGARGGGIHTSDEYMIIDSLVERAQLTTLLLATLNQTGNP